MEPPRVRREGPYGLGVWIDREDEPAHGIEIRKIDGAQRRRGGRLRERAFERGLVGVEVRGEEKAAAERRGELREQRAVGVVAVFDDRGRAQERRDGLGGGEDLRARPLVVLAVRHEEQVHGVGGGHARSDGRGAVARDEIRQQRERLFEPGHADRDEPAVDQRMDRLEIGERRDRRAVDEHAALALAGEPDERQEVRLADERRELGLELHARSAGRSRAIDPDIVEDRDVVRGGVLDRRRRDVRRHGAADEKEIVGEAERRPGGGGGGRRKLFGGHGISILPLAARSATMRVRDELADEVLFGLGELLFVEVDRVHVRRKKGRGFGVRNLDESALAFHDVRRRRLFIDAPCRTARETHTRDRRGERRRPRCPPAGRRRIPRDPGGRAPHRTTLGRARWRPPRRGVFDEERTRAAPRCASAWLSVLRRRGARFVRLVGVDPHRSLAPVVQRTMSSSVALKIVRPHGFVSSTSPSTRRTPRSLP